MYRLFIIVVLFFMLLSCKKDNSNTPIIYKYTNDLINETSPYLLQHAHNPVDWKAWNKETLDLAKKENKLIIISIGYSACHWCHVMEKESFKNDSVAKIMNDNFINIKVDREERPDIDQIYLGAVELITGKSAGWPLNCIALPDGSPVFGGTFFTKDKWIDVLKKMTHLYEKEPKKLIEYAENVRKGIIENELDLINNETTAINKSIIKNIIDKWKTFFDNEQGGIKENQKFPKPNNYQFLLRYGIQNQNKDVLDFTLNTLDKMAYGGIFDHIGGGFSRYTVDTKWHIPHFEKMLYDNAQLVSLYSDAYLITKKDLYKEVIEETLTFIEREMRNKNGAFYSSLDADSKTHEGELNEGEFYKWTQEELKKIITKDFEIFKEYYNINSYGKWEDEYFILIRNKTNKEIAKKYNLSTSELKLKVKNWKAKLFKERSKRKRPELDDKTLTSWNALMLKGYIDAYRVLNNNHYLEIALKNAEFIINNQLRVDGGLNHSYKNGKSTINGYLEDYATTIDAFIALYEATLEEKWLNLAKQLTEYSFNHFYDENNYMFFFTSTKDNNLIIRKREIHDKAIPSSNSLMARNLFKLSHYYSNQNYIEISKKMLNNVVLDIKTYPIFYSNWLQLVSDFSHEYYEIAVSGKKALDKIQEINQTYIPNKLIVGAVGESSIPLMEERFNEDETYIYVCVDGTCKRPEKDVQKALSKIKVIF